jgi:cytidylate kinase
LTKKEVSLMAEMTPSERSLDFIRVQTRPVQQVTPDLNAEIPARVITISRQAGSGAHVVSEELLSMLAAPTSPAAVPWRIVDRDLVERVLEDHDLPGRIAEFMPEDQTSAVADTLDELFGFHPSRWSLVRKTAETILHLAELGDVIIIGRAGNIITQHLAGAIHVRLVGSEARRTKHVMEYHGLDHEAASDYVRDHDLGRERYVEKYYARDIDDPLLYHMVLNTDRLGYRGTARVIADSMRGTMVDRRSARTSLEALPIAGT